MEIFENQTHLSTEFSNHPQQSHHLPIKTWRKKKFFQPSFFSRDVKNRANRIPSLYISGGGLIIGLPAEQRLP